MRGLPPELRMLAAAALVVAAAAGLAGCRSAQKGSTESELVREPLEGVAEEFLAPLETLRDAVRAGDDEVARRILARILAREPEGRTREVAEGFLRILDGRAPAASLSLSLVGELDGRGGITLYLEAKNLTRRELLLLPGPASLRYLRVAVDPMGREERQATTSALGTLELDPVPPLGRSRRELTSFPLAGVGRLAARDRWSLVLRSGHIACEGVRYPAQRVVVRPFELTRQASFLPSDPVEPAVLAEYAGGERISMPQLMERAVRIAPERREEALDLLVPIAERMSPQELGRLVPALRWLSGTTRPGGDPLAWRRLLEEREEAREAEASALDLPDHDL